ncbi:MAG TPA: GNAT family N-acetyltransferase [Ktedonobacterales bacterium]|nr:GNAT family N-acetyltransferase [Ktedonobacterales bacterium]
MEVDLRPVTTHDIEGLVHLSLLAWEPVFRSFERVLGAHIYALLYPDWRGQQRKVVEDVCRDTATFSVWVAEVNAVLTGFIAYTMNPEDKSGEVELLAVHPDYQNQGIGAQLNTFALNKMKDSGVKLAVVATGGDPGHAPARRSYEKAGYTALPLVRYYKAL